mgnify:CR=1 FL=1
MKSTPFKVQMKTRSGGKSKMYSFRSARGTEEPRNILPEEVLLLKGADIEKTDAVLSIDSRIGVPGCVLGDQVSAGRITITESNARASLLCELNRRGNDVSSAEVMLSSDIRKDCIRKFDKVAYVPKRSDPDHLVKQKLHDATQVLREDGTIYFSTKKKRAEEVEELLDDLGEVNQKINGDEKLLELENPEKKRRNRQIQDKRIEHSIKGEKCRFKTLEGTFSAERLNMIEMAARELDLSSGDKLLDLEAGFGGVGIFASKLYDADPVFVDRNAHMRDFTRENCELNDVEDFEALCEDGAENLDLAEFDAVVYCVDGSRDLKVVEEDIHDCRRVLKESGKLYIVHRKKFNLEKVVRKVFGDARAQRREGHFQVTCVEK